MRALLLLLVVIGGLYLIILLYLYFSQNSLIYFPERRLGATPEKLGLDFESVTLASGKSLIHGWFIPADSGSPVVLFCHGNAGNIADRLELLEQIHTAGLAVFIFDYSGYGQSTGEPSERQLYADAEAAYASVLARGYRPEEIVLYGRSLGGAVAAQVARGKNVRALVLDGSFTAMADVAGVHYPWVPARLLLRSRFETVASLAEVSVPVVVIHNRDDEVVPFRIGQKLFAAAREPKRFIAMEGSHNTLIATDWSAVLAGPP